MINNEEIIKLIKMNMEKDSLFVNDRYYSEEIIYRWNQMLDLLDEIDILQKEYKENI